MEIYIFNGYLKFIKDMDNGLLKKFFKLPPKIIIAFIISALGFIFYIFSFFISGLRRFILVSIIVESICFVIIYYYTERYEIDYSNKHLDNYKYKISKIHKWLLEKEIDTKEQILTIQLRIRQRKENEDNKQKSSNESFYKWVQILILPAILAVLASSLQKINDISLMIEFAMTLIVMFSIIFLFVSQIRNLIIVFKRRKIDKMSLFIDDLQGVLDIKYGTLLECPKEENHSDFV